jgi:hypothetical protein
VGRALQVLIHKFWGSNLVPEIGYYERFLVDVLSLSRQMPG